MEIILQICQEHINILSVNIISHTTELNEEVTDLTRSIKEKQWSKYVTFLPSFSESILTNACCTPVIRDCRAG